MAIKMMKGGINIVFFFFVLFVNVQVFAQTDYLDSLNKVLLNVNDDGKVSVYIDLAYAYFEHGELGLAQESANKAIILSDKVKDKKGKANAFNMLASIALVKGRYSFCIINAEKAIKIGNEINNQTINANAYFTLGNAYYWKSEYQRSLKNFQESLNIFRQLNDKASSAKVLYLIGVIYKNWSEYNTAIEYYEKALSVYKELNNEVAMAQIFASLANIYFDSDIDIDKALENYKKALKVFKEKGLKKLEAGALTNIGLILEKKSLYNDALLYYEECLKIAEEINDDYWKAQASSNIGNIYLSKQNFKSALENFNKSLKIFESQERKKDVALLLKDIANMYHLWNKNNEAKEYYLRSISLCEELDLKKELSDNYKELALVLADLDDYKNAFKYHRLYSEQNDSIFSAEYKEMITEWNARMETAEKEAKIREQEATFQAEIKRKNYVMYSAIGVILIVLIFSALLYKQFSEKKRANILLQDQNEEIKAQRDKIVEQNREITDSIEYASKIQSAILPPDDFVSGILDDYFIVYRPRDIVSGDFYWVNKKENKIYMCAADCTGHGVPGAFMSMMGVALLNEIISKKDNYNAAEILENLRLQVVNSLHQRGNEGETQDGMDIAFCIVDINEMKLQFAGAFNPLFILRNGELHEFKGDKMPIGVHIKQNEPFTNHEIQIFKNDILYTFSDGYIDQFGGPHRKKFMIKRFRELLQSIWNKPLNEQKTILENSLDQWIGGYDQIDDILVFGAKI